jgi:hypothetical protein
MLSTRDQRSAIRSQRSLLFGKSEIRNPKSAMLSDLWLLAKIEKAIGKIEKQKAKIRKIRISAFNFLLSTLHRKLSAFRFPPALPPSRLL